MSDVLPPAFRHLEPFLATWDLPSSNDRYRQRLATPLEAMQRFNDAIVASADAIKAHLDARRFEDYDDADRRLVNLMLAFTVVAQAVQIYRRPAVPDSGSVPMFDFALEPWNG
ncbi:MAG TPA: hypothetical protein VJM11_03010 [Nevskiaceae bacterium]|nr:hypothetical protein [Nevskiaceae bacterium]